MGFFVVPVIDIAPVCGSVGLAIAGGFAVVGGCVAGAAADFGFSEKFPSRPLGQLQLQHSLLPQISICCRHIRYNLNSSLRRRPIHLPHIIVRLEEYMRAEFFRLLADHAL